VPAWDYNIVGFSDDGPTISDIPEFEGNEELKEKLLLAAKIILKEEISDEVRSIKPSLCGSSPHTWGKYFRKCYIYNVLINCNPSK
jgi:hypothetical protein